MCLLENTAVAYSRKFVGITVLIRFQVSKEEYAFPIKPLLPAALVRRLERQDRQSSLLLGQTDRQAAGVQAKPGEAAQGAPPAHAGRAGRGDLLTFGGNPCPKGGGRLHLGQLLACITGKCVTVPKIPSEAE